MGHLNTCYACKKGKGCVKSRGSVHAIPRWTFEPKSNDSFDWLLYEDRLMAMSRSKSASEAVPMLWTDEEFFVEYENLYEFLRETQWDDGKPRKTGTMLITVDAGSLKAVVHDRDGKRCAWITADTFKQLLNRIDTAIGTATLEWRRDTR